MPAARRDRPATGLACVAASVLLFALNNALIQAVALRPLAMLQARSLLEWCLLSVALGARVPPAAASGTAAARFFGETPLRPVLFLRSGAYWVFIVLFWNALANMPIGDATSLVFLSPFVAAFFGWLLLGETVRSRILGCLLLSLAGIGLITQPTFLFGGAAADEAPAGAADYRRGVLFACGAAVAGGLLPVLTRRSREAHWATVEHVSALASSVVFTPLALGASALAGGAAAEAASWEGLRDPATLLLLGAVALLSFAALGLNTYGYQHEKVAVASAMIYIEIPASYLLQYVVFGVLLTPTQLLGVALVIASGLINLYPRLRESQGAVAPLPDKAPRNGNESGPEPTDVQREDGSVDPKSILSIASVIDVPGEREEAQGESASDGSAAPGAAGANKMFRRPLLASALVVGAVVGTGVLVARVAPLTDGSPAPEPLQEAQRLLELAERILAACGPPVTESCPALCDAHLCCLDRGDPCDDGLRRECAVYAGCRALFDLRRAPQH